MILINKLTFYNSETKEYRSEIALYEDAQFYKVLHESGAKINGQIFLNKNDAIDSLLRNACASITKMKFIILNNKVLNLTVYCSKLSTNSGKILENNIKSDIDLKLYQNKDIEGQIIDFYFINELI